MAKVFVNTVTGTIATEDLGITMMHEHILYGFAGWEGDLSVAPFDRKAIVKTGVEYLEKLKDHGVSSFVDVTPVDGGRNPEIYREVSEKTGVNIICATGHYYEGGGSSAYYKFRSAFGNVVEEITELFVREITQGIRETGIKPGVIKIGSSGGVITDYERTVFAAAARAQKETGVPIITHTQLGTMGPEQAELLISEGADPARIQIGHMSDNLNLDYQLKTLSHGVCVAWDRMGLQGVENCPTDEERCKVLVELMSRGYTEKLMLSQDYVPSWLGRPVPFPEEIQQMMVNWRPGGLFDAVIPMLMREGASEAQINTILTGNPRRLFEGSAGKR
jgi:phosphotriesterase-related protein